MSPLLRARLALQGIRRPMQGTAADVVRHLLAVQAQDYIGAKWAIGLRLAGATDATVDRAVNQPNLVRTHVLRPTWHFVAAEDIRWLLALTGPRVLQINASTSRKLGLNDKHVVKAHRAIARALEGGRYLTREELADAINRAGMPTPTGQHLAYIVMNAEQQALICNGPRRGRQFTYALMDERVPAQPLPDRDELLGRLATRFFGGHGPATVRDLARWASLTLADCTRAVDIAGRALAARIVDGVTYYTTPDAPPPARGALGAHLLNIYDELFAGYRDRSAMINAADERAITSRGAAVREAFLVEGRVRGTWTRTFSRDDVDLTLQPFGRLTAAEQRALRAAAVPYAKFFGARARVSFG